MTPNDINISLCVNKICDCGQFLIFVLPEMSRSLGKALQDHPEFSVITISGDSNACPKCGWTYTHPPAEAFEPIRHPIGRFLLNLKKELEDNPPKRLSQEELSDLPF